VPCGQETITDLACQESLALMREPESCSRSAGIPAEGQCLLATRASQTDVAVGLWRSTQNLAALYVLSHGCVTIVLVREICITVSGPIWGAIWS
jgi:hypothetical protein